MFDILSDRLHHLLDRLRKKSQLTSQDLEQFSRQLKLTLLEADVAPQVVQQLIKAIQEPLRDPKLLQRISPSEAIMKLLKEQLTNLLGKKKTDMATEGAPAVLMMVGLQGSGKTTSTAKLADWLQQQEHKKVAVVSLDIYRPAARQQLQIVAHTVGAGYLDVALQDVVAMAQEAYRQAQLEQYDILLVDTAGRLHVDQHLMQELEQLQKALQPQEILLVLDSMMGQDAALTARSFSERLPITGAILTKMDGDARGGAALSISYLAHIPIKWVGIGEKVQGYLEPFDPERLAGRILGEGDVASLLEKAVQKIGQPKVKAMTKKALEGGLNFNDLLEQLRQIKKLGNIQQLVKHLPLELRQQMQLPTDPTRDLHHKIAIILSMTRQERVQPDLIRGSRKRRIAAGSGRQVAEVNQLIKQFEMMRKMSKKMGKKTQPNQLEQMMSQLGGSI